MSGNRDPSIDALADRPPGYDESDPYEDVDVSTLPDWWQAAIAEFEAHDFRPFRPPVFEDGSVVQEVIDEVESRFGVTVSIRCTNPDRFGDWIVCVDGTEVAEFPRRRRSSGNTIYGLSSDDLRGVVRHFVER